MSLNPPPQNKRHGLRNLWTQIHDVVAVLQVMLEIKQFDGVSRGAFPAFGWRTLFVQVPLQRRTFESKSEIYFV